ncbi:hypothetical protein GOBAR_AA00636 [Gossypium barbadense]|uniref:HVA22-like protein n=1 Tax=Gossypium barbadense TaxID=3634 RepID=A0A2P5YWJ6_GOSBA|nr:hypothetical protein GOBAR_AA00636 [Gossypium barbadense]
MASNLSILPHLFLVSMQFSHHRKYLSTGTFCYIVKEHEHQICESSCTRHSISPTGKDMAKVKELWYVEEYDVLALALNGKMKPRILVTLKLSTVRFPPPNNPNLPCKPAFSILSTSAFLRIQNTLVTQATAAIRAKPKLWRFQKEKEHWKVKMGSGAGSFLKVFFKNFDILAGPVISLLYPLYASVRAIESESRADDRQWLTYWVLYSMITLLELTFAKVIEWTRKTNVRLSMNDIVITECPDICLTPKYPSLNIWSGLSGRIHCDKSPACPFQARSDPWDLSESCGSRGILGRMVMREVGFTEQR